jgi:signal transduction histidine kinase
MLTSDAVALVFHPPAAEIELVSDEAKVSQILRNFISNAIKFTERGEIRVSAELGDDDMVSFIVSDTGIGIAPDDQSRIFEEFEQVEHALQRRAAGTGLGLPLSRKLAGLLGGGIELASTVGVGSRFTLRIPRVYQAASEPGLRESGGGHVHA